MKKIKTIIYILLLLLPAAGVAAQQKVTVSGKLLSDRHAPISGGIVSVPGAADVVTAEDGTFTLEVDQQAKQISFWAVGFHPATQQLNDRRQITVVMIPEDAYKYNETVVLPFRTEHNPDPVTSAVNLDKSNFKLGSMTVDRALSGQVAGLQVTRSSGMPGEGSYLNLRGLRSFVGANTPLYVINGVPYLPDANESPLINGYTRDILQPFNIMDIQNITVLKGAEASLYGSLGSNGVILIETDGASSEDLETKISFYGQYGVNWNKKRIPLLEGVDYKSYLSDVGMNYFDTMEDFFTAFPFMNNPDYLYGYLYNHETDWQEKLYRNSFVTDNLFRVEGGDAIAKYNLSLGYMMDNGILDETKIQRYHTLLNTNVFINKSMELFATIGMSYLTGNYQEQGMSEETNPILAAYKQAPILSPFAQDIDGNLLASYNSYYYGRSTNLDFATSNPLAILKTLDASNRQYDINLRTGLNYSITPNL
ncbi:MAG: TonB-dependent receptor plug domain-containing protein, partial [Rikenellaceae bacterium]|nr:TonB-dependent receptor plug domain-containing protein [Rikenellaceae bacterium]